MKPILFNTDMVQALSDGKKTVTRRVIKPQPIQKICYHGATDKWFYCNGMEVGDECKPPYRPGDILYVRETYCGWHLPDGQAYYAYKAKDPFGNKAPSGPEYDDEWFTIPWRPSIHMPKKLLVSFSV